MLKKILEIMCGALPLLSAPAGSPGNAAAGPLPNPASVAAEKIRVLGVIGNSLTRHGPSADIGWHGDWGMAATAKERDFCHLLLKKLNQRFAKSLKQPIELQILNGSVREKDLGQWNAEAGRQADILIFQIGDNFRRCDGFDPEKHFISRYEQMLRDFRKARPQQLIYCVSSFGDSAVSSWIETACRRLGVGFVSIETIKSDPVNRAKSEGHFTHGGVNWHPGDRGMAAIADAIYQEIIKNLED